MSMFWKAIAVGALTAFVSQPGSATVLALTLQGNVGEITDSSGVLGGAAVGDPYTLVYRADFSRGIYGGGGGGFGGSVNLVGGTSVTYGGYPTVPLSPVSASLFIGGARYDFSGTYYGEMSYVHNSFDIMFGGTGQSWARLTANGEPGAPGGNIATGIDSDVLATFDRDLFDLIDVTIDGTHITGSSQFTYATGAASASGTLNAASYRVSVVPEPMTWALMAGGFGLIGVSLRRRAVTPLPAAAPAATGGPTG
jgi:hypothetical protein